MNKILIIGYVWPEPDSSAAGSHMMSVLRLFKRQGWQVEFSTPAQSTEHMVDLTSEGIGSQSINLNCDSFDEYISDYQPDMVLFDRFMMEEQFSWRVDKECPNAVKLLETVDLHCLRDARNTALKNNINPYDLNNLEFNTDTAVREVASILRSDLSLMISEVEVEILKNQYNVDESLLLYLPFMYQSLDEKECKEKWPSYSDREHFVTIGNFRHAPNWDSVLYLKNTIWPRSEERRGGRECR